MGVKKIIIPIIIFVCIAFTSIALFTIYMLNRNTFDNINPIAKKSMIETTLVWGRLAPIPQSKTEFDIHTEGSPFTRSFRSSFYLPGNDLEKWIKASPGIIDSDIEKINDSKQKYVIKPGGGAQYAEVVIDSKKSFVEIYVYWS